mmetsp:Transcript_14733/g.22848  ORF Transcript_14733/g.22848 Transcript_14733/m.22848 type:complete len:114 (-) Transcript_14733:997-1338(-)
MGNASSTKGPQFLKVTKDVAKMAVSISKGFYPYRLKPLEYSFLSYSDRFRTIRSKLLLFIEKYILGTEHIFVEELNSVPDRWKHTVSFIEPLKKKAKEWGLWNLFLPSESKLT